MTPAVSSKASQEVLMGRRRRSEMGERKPRAPAFSPSELKFMMKRVQERYFSCYVAPFKSGSQREKSPRQHLLREITEALNAKYTYIQRTEEQVMERVKTDVYKIKKFIQREPDFVPSEHRELPLPRHAWSLYAIIKTGSPLEDMHDIDGDEDDYEEEFGGEELYDDEPRTISPRELMYQQVLEGDIKPLLDGGHYLHIPSESTHSESPPPSPPPQESTSSISTDNTNTDSCGGDEVQLDRRRPRKSPPTRLPPTPGISSTIIQTTPLFEDSHLSSTSSGSDDALRERMELENALLRAKTDVELLKKKLLEKVTEQLEMGQIDSLTALNVLRM